MTKMANNIPGVVLSKYGNNAAFPAKENVIGVGIGFVYEAGVRTGEVGIPVLVSERVAKSDPAAKTWCPMPLMTSGLTFRKLAFPASCRP